jgi:hypothetical protein
MGYNSRLNQSCCYDQEIKWLPSQWKANHSTCEESEAGHRLNGEEHVVLFLLILRLLLGNLFLHATDLPTITSWRFYNI